MTAPKYTDYRISYDYDFSTKHLNLQLTATLPPTRMIHIERIAIKQEELSKMKYPMTKEQLIVFLEYLVKEEGKNLADAVFIMLNGGKDLETQEMLKDPVDGQVDSIFNVLKADTENKHGN